MLGRRVSPENARGTPVLVFVSKGCLPALFRHKNFPVISAECAAFLCRFCVKTIRVKCFNIKSPLRLRPEPALLRLTGSDRVPKSRLALSSFGSLPSARRIPDATPDFIAFEFLCVLAIILKTLCPNTCGSPKPLLCGSMRHLCVYSGWKQIKQPIEYQYDGVIHLWFFICTNSLAKRRQRHG